MLKKIKNKIRSHNITNTHALAWEIVYEKDEFSKEQRVVLIAVFETQGYKGANAFILRKNKKNIAQKTLSLIEEHLKNTKIQNKQDVNKDKEIYILSLLVVSLQNYIKK